MTTYVEHFCCKLLLGLCIWWNVITNTKCSWKSEFLCYRCCTQASSGLDVFSWFLHSTIHLVPLDNTGQPFYGQQLHSIIYKPIARRGGNKRRGGPDDVEHYDCRVILSAKLKRRKLSESLGLHLCHRHLRDCRVLLWYLCHHRMSSEETTTVAARLHWQSSAIVNRLVSCLQVS